MYSFIEGKLEEIKPAYVVVYTNGIGYLLNISLNTYSQIKDKSEYRLFTHLVVREDAMILFGFADKEERHLFRELISVSGIGPNTARVILSSLSPAEVQDAITSEKISVLQSVKGIGAKSAQRIIVDLKDRFTKRENFIEFSNLTHNRAREEALSGLIMLGFNKHVIEKTLDKILNSPDIHQGKDALALSVEDLIKQALKLL
jgi:Holliday junction DNA helicase RuvA